MLASGLGTSGVSVSLDWPLLGVTAGLACIAGLIAGLLPALRFSRNTDAMLKDCTGAGVPTLKIGRALLAPRSPCRCRSSPARVCSCARYTTSAA